jgi:hypothetical protein
MYQIKIDDDFGYYSCKGELDNEYYSEFNGKIYIYDSEVRLEEVDFYYKISRDIKTKELSAEEFIFSVESADISSFTNGFGLISFSNPEANASFTSLCKFKSTVLKNDSYRQGCPPDVKQIEKSLLYISLFAGLKPSEQQRNRFENFFDNVDEFTTRLEDSKNSLYEKNWRFSRGWIRSGIQRCVTDVNSYFDNLKIVAPDRRIDDEISEKEIELIMQVVPFWVGGEMVRFAKAGASEKEFMNWLSDQHVSEALVSHREILSVYLVMCRDKS